MEIRGAFSTETIDFTESSIEWNRNKRKLGNGMYRYICVGFFRNGKSCNRLPLPFMDTCRTHHTDISNNSTGSMITQISSSNNVKIKPELSSEISETVEVLQSPIRKKQNSCKYVNILKNVTNHLWKSSKTLPIFDTSSEETKEVELHRVPVINVRYETITIFTTPQIVGTFAQIRNAIRKYHSIECIDRLHKIKKKRYDVSDVIYKLNLMLSFLEGLRELTKLDMKRRNIMEVKSDILEFFGYDVTMYLNTTASKWDKTSTEIRQDIVNVMSILFSELPSP